MLSKLVCAEYSLALSHNVEKTYRCKEKRMIIFLTSQDAIGDAFVCVSVRSAFVSRDQRPRGLSSSFGIPQQTQVVDLVAGIFNWVSHIIGHCLPQGFSSCTNS